VKNLLSLVLILLIVSSCKKEAQETNIQSITTSIKIDDVINPPAAPEIYTNNSVEPKIKIRNTGATTISSFAIIYYIDINNTGGGYCVRPTTTFFCNLKPSSDTTVVLDKWESYTQFKLANGTHMLFLNITQINTEPFHQDDNNNVKRLFKLEI